MKPSTQLPLSLSLKDTNTFSRYYVGQNQEAVSFLEAFLQQQEQDFIYLWGKANAGKSHLTQACCHSAEKLNKTSFYLSCNPSTGHAVLENVESYQLTCLDNIDLLMGNKLWEEKLFCLYNNIKEKQHKLVVTANCPPAQLPCQLKDLQSRLSSGLTFQLHTLSDTDKTQALILRAQHRGLTLPQEAADYIIHRSPRDLTTLFNCLNTLDRASLAQQRRLTIPFIKSVLF